MPVYTNYVSLRSAALIAGVALFIMVIAAPFAELFVYPKLVIAGNAAQTATNIIAHKSLFIAGIMAYLVTFTGDLVVAWALYILLKPVNGSIALLAAWFRLVFAVIAVVSLLNLVFVLRLLDNADFSTIFTPQQLYAQVMLALYQFRYGFHFGIIFFSIHLGLMGYLVFKSKYIPRIMGVLLIISGLGYMATTLKPFLFPNINIDFAVYTFYGELIFMLWLLIKGSKIKEQPANT